MDENFKNFRTLIREELAKVESPSYEAVDMAFKREMELLLKDGIVRLRPEHTLGKFALEYYVKDVFANLGFPVESGPLNLYDAIIKPMPGFSPNMPLVLEIKSSKEPSPTRNNLRQLDDWVFELSGEEIARKGKLKWRGDRLRARYANPTVRHPTPHKGVMVFNGPIGQPFLDRSNNWLGENERIFAEKRYFCIMSLYCLISWHDKCIDNQSLIQDFWRIIQMTAGVMPDTEYS